MLTVHWFPWGHMQMTALQALIAMHARWLVQNTTSPQPTKQKFTTLTYAHKNNPKCNVHVDNNVTGWTCLAIAPVGHCECGNNHFDLRQQQDLAQELGAGDYDAHNHSAYERYTNGVARTLIRQYRPCRANPNIRVQL